MNDSDGPTICVVASTMTDMISYLLRVPNTGETIVGNSLTLGFVGDATVSAHNDGPGIPREVMPWLFTRFAPSSDSECSGLGLYLARSITEAYGGPLTIDALLSN